MKTVSFDERILEALKGLIEHHSSSRCVAEQMGQAHNYVARLLRGETKLRLDVLGRILETLGVSHRFFLEMVLVDRPDDSDATDILRFFCGDAPPTESFLEDIQPTLDVLVRMPLVDAPDFPSRRDELAQFEELRRTDRDAAEEGLRMMALDMLADPPVPVPRQMLEDLGVALATYGTVQRFSGHRPNAARSFAAAFQVAARGDRPHGMAWVYRKAAYLVRDHGQCQAGLRFLERAQDRFLRAGEVDVAMTVFVDKAVFWGNLGDTEMAVRDFETAVKLIPEDERWFRHISYSGLAHAYKQLGELEKALEASQHAEALHEGGENIALAFLVRNRAELAAALGDVATADSQYRRAIELHSKYSEPVDAAICALDLAAFLMQRGKPEAVRKLADDMLKWLPAFRGSRVADAVIAEFIRCAKWGELTGKVLQTARERLEKAQVG